MNELFISFHSVGEKVLFYVEKGVEKVSVIVEKYVVSYDKGVMISYDKGVDKGDIL